MKLFNSNLVSQFITKHHKSSLAILLLCGTLFMLIWGTLKSPTTFHVDEMWQYSFANSNGMTTKVVESDQLGEWLSPTVFRDYITVQPNEQFSFKQIVRSAENDIHPPLSHILLNSVSSLFPNQFSKWFGLAINIAFYLMTLCALYFLSSSLFASKSKALITTALWGFSVGAVDTVMYIRMYCPITFFTVALMVFSVKYMKGDGNKFLILVYCTLLLGGLTDYIYWIFGFYATIAFILVMLHRNFRLCVNYALVSLAAFISVCALFPTTILQIFDKDSFSNQAAESFSVAEQISLFFNVPHVLNRFLFHSSEKIFLLPPKAVISLIILLGILLLLFITCTFLLSFLSSWLSNETKKETTLTSKVDPIATNLIVLDKVKSVAPAAYLIFLENIKIIGLFLKRIIVSNLPAVYLTITVVLCTYTLAVIFPDFQEWTVRAFFFLLPFFSILVASTLFFLHKKCRIPAGFLLITILLLLFRGYISNSSLFLFPDGYEKLERKLEGANVIIVLDTEDSIMRLPNFCTSLAGARAVYLLAIDKANCLSEMMKAVNTAQPDSRTMVINLIGSPPQNSVATGLLGPESLLSANETLMSALTNAGYKINIEKKNVHIFQWFNLYRVSQL